MKKHLINSIGILALVIIVQACGSTKNMGNTATTAAVPAEAVSYKIQIQPIIENNCAVQGCHVQGFEGADFTFYEDLKKHADKGRIKRMVVENKTMPPDKPLSAAECKLIDNWLKQGSKNN